ncbi:hypothetical protein [Streptomyces sp. NPDC048248]|uniref:hypothetical protein n=1 Tax=Streptomyces sp. NPDC048248 TaxID=3365523 RepID=UPI003723CE69
MTAERSPRSESAELAADYSQDMADLAFLRARVAAVLGLDLPTKAAVLARLREIATKAGKHHDLICTPENLPYSPLIAT